MKVEIKLSQEYTEPTILILTDHMTDKITDLVKQLSEPPPKLIVGYSNNTLHILEPQQIIRIYTENGKIKAITNDGAFYLRCRLFELEESLPPKEFIRISQSEIIHIKYVKHFDVSLTGTIGVIFNNGTSTYVSRRYISKLKKHLGL